jgi:hypothetical protein
MMSQLMLSRCASQAEIEVGREQRLPHLPLRKLTDQSANQLKLTIAMRTSMKREITSLLLMPQIL